MKQDLRGGICIEEVFERHPELMDVLLCSIDEVRGALSSIIYSDERVHRRVFCPLHLQIALSQIRSFQLQAGPIGALLNSTQPCAHSDRGIQQYEFCRTLQLACKVREQASCLPGRSCFASSGSCILEPTSMEASLYYLCHDIGQGLTKEAWRGW